MTDKQLNRRAFGGQIAAGVAAPLVAAGIRSDTGEAAQKPEDAKPPTPVDRMLEMIRQQYPDSRLDDAGIAEIREELEAQVSRSARLSAFRLSNADEPGFVFRAYRGEEKIEDRR